MGIYFVRHYIPITYYAWACEFYSVLVFHALKYEVRYVVRGSI